MSEPLNPQEARDRAIMERLGGIPTAPSAVTYPGYSVPPTPDPAVRFPVEEGAGRWPLVVWIVPDFIIGVALALVYQLAVMLAFLVASGRIDVESANDLQNSYNFLLLAAPAIGLALTSVAVLRVRVLRKLPWSWFNLNTRAMGWFKTVLWGMIGGIAFLIVNATTSLIFRSLGSEPDQAEQLTGPFKGAAVWQLALLGLFIVVIGPLLEEIFFRGYVMRAILQRFGRVAAVAGSAVIFAVPHILGITTGFLGLVVPLFFGGVVLALVYYYTGSLWSAFIAHMFNNLVAFLSLLAILQQ